MIQYIDVSHKKRILKRKNDCVKPAVIEKNNAIAGKPAIFGIITQKNRLTGRETRIFWGK
jgi:hypothetical protein